MVNMLGTKLARFGDGLQTFSCRLLSGLLGIGSFNPMVVRPVPDPLVVQPDNKGLHVVLLDAEASTKKPHARGGAWTRWVPSLTGEPTTTTLCHGDWDASGRADGRVDSLAVAFPVVRFDAESERTPDESDIVNEVEVTGHGVHPVPVARRAADHVEGSFAPLD